ncbi:MAG TPA: cytochrome ubiquinol oxidase subunit I [Armatimonadota bacterium]|jgi:cytochrome d ubiquinol oxidase subunit I
MDAVLLARLQFALTVGFHFLFPPLTIGLAWLNTWLLWRYRATGEDVYRQLGRFWLKLFAITFAIGVATGITMEFQFGMNWASYSRFVGDIFGAPLAAEAILAFFLESVFAGVLFFGWNRLSRGALWFASLMVAVGSTLSAFWIIVANSWMQTPAGFILRHGRAELTDFWAAVFNPSTLPRYLHTVDAALIAGAFFMLGISAWFLLKDRHVDAARRSLTLALVVAFLASVAELGLGHYHAVQVAHTQPVKLAAFEGLFTTQRQAPLLLFGLPDAQTKTVRYAVRIPAGLSLLVDFDNDANIKGLDEVAPSDWPPLLATFIPFHLMVLLGMYFIAFSGIGMLLLWKKRAHGNRLFLTLAVWSIPLPLVAANVGWMAAEVGRQPWIVQNVLRTSDAVSLTVPAGQILASILIFSAIYAVLLYTWVRLLSQTVMLGMEPAAPVVVEEVVA